MIPNPPAFPFQYEDRSTSGIVNTVVVEGMTLRDHYAGLALQALLTRGARDKLDDYVQDSFTAADAMLLYRQKA